MNICVKCAAPIADGKMFCGSCGEKQPFPPANPRNARDEMRDVAMGEATAKRLGDLEKRISLIEASQVKAEEAAQAKRPAEVSEVSARVVSAIDAVKTTLNETNAHVASLDEEIKSLKASLLLTLTRLDFLEAFDIGEKLVQSAAEGNLEALIFLLNNNKCNINIRRRVDGATALHVASLANHEEVVKWLLDHGADVNAQDVVCIQFFVFRAVYLTVCIMIECKDAYGHGNSRTTTQNRSSPENKTGRRRKTSLMNHLGVHCSKTGVI